MSQAEARAWWADVQHLRPDAPAVAEAPASASFQEHEHDAGDELAQRRRGRITGRARDDRHETHLTRSDAAGFAEALSLEDELDSVPDRRTVHITGMPDPAPVRRLYEVEQRRERTPASERMTARPDRVALYAVALGIFLVLLAAVSSSADAAMLIH